MNTAGYAAAPPQPSSVFALVTLLCYFLVFPIGAILNLIGLITGPRRGCFAAMFLLILVPSATIIGIAIALVATGALDDLERAMEKPPTAEQPWNPPAWNEPSNNLDPYAEPLLPYHEQTELGPTIERQSYPQSLGDELAPFESVPTAELDQSLFLRHPKVR